MFSQIFKILICGGSDSDRSNAYIQEQNKGEKLERRRQAHDTKEQYQAFKVSGWQWLSNYLSLKLCIQYGQELRKTQGFVYKAGETISGVPVPGTYREAISDPIYCAKWRKAIHKLQ